MKYITGICLLLFGLTSLANTVKSDLSECTSLDRNDNICNSGSKLNNPDRYSCDEILQDVGCDNIPTSLPAYTKCCLAKNVNISECSFNDDNSRINCPNADYVIDRSSLSSQLRSLKEKLKKDKPIKPNNNPPFSKWK